MSARHYNQWIDNEEKMLESGDDYDSDKNHHIRSDQYNSTNKGKGRNYNAKSKQNQHNDYPNDLTYHVYDDKYGDCYRVYCTFECKKCNITWTADNAWECYDQNGDELYFGQKCFGCNQYRYPEINGEMLYFNDYKDLYQNDDECYDYEYDDKHGECYRVYCTFECKPCKIAWPSHNAWQCYDKRNKPLWFGEKCFQCERYRYPRRDSEVLDFKEFKRRYHCAKDQWIDGYIDEAYIVRRFGFYRCDCKNPDCHNRDCSKCNGKGCGECYPNQWTSAWTWTIKYFEKAFYKQDCRACYENNCKGRKHKHKLLKKINEEYGVLAHRVIPTVKGAGDKNRKLKKQDHDQKACHLCRYESLSCPEKFKNDPNPEWKVRGVHWKHV